MASVDSLFRPFTSANLDIKNRILMAPMTRNMCPDHVPRENVVEYYRKRAAGGVGLIITEGTHPALAAAEGYQNVPFFWGEALDGWRDVVSAVHAEGGKIAPQLWHCGGMRGSGDIKIGEHDVPGHTPSGMNMPGKVNRHAMTTAEIDETIQAFADAALAAKELGFDAVELHAAHGYLLDQFFWAGTNIREDQWGGSFEARSHFVVEIVRAVRAAVGPDFAVLLRYSQWKQQDFSVRLVETPQLLEQFLSPLVDAGVDIFHCSQRRFWDAEFEGSDLNLAGWTKKLTGKPSITVGSISLDRDFIPAPGEGVFSAGDVASIDKLLEALERDEFDLAAVGRALIANPDWANKVQAGGVEDLHPYEKDMLMTLA